MRRTETEVHTITLKLVAALRLLIASAVAALLLMSRCAPEQQPAAAYYPTSKPMVRWWWFATRIQEEDLRHQLQWVKQQGFGGVEICWLYPLYRYQKMYAEKYNRYYPKDTTAPKWLSPEWSRVVAFAKRYADTLGLACDFTFGSAWIIAATYMDKRYRTQIYGDSSFHQALTYAWTYPDTQWVINHLDSHAFRQYAGPMVAALRPALTGTPTALFTDSWEIKMNATHKIWTPGFEQSFRKAFGYDIIPFMEAGLDSFPDVRYDYMQHIEEHVMNGYYRPFAAKCRELGVWSRVQCLGAPADVMRLYGLADIPETEAMLNNPRYARIVSSAAALAGKPLVSCEAFTCMYGFPATYLRQEQTADLKMVADELIAQGVNHLIYHGMPYQSKGADSIDFIATVYIGPNGSLTPELPAFNHYVERVCSLMQQGRTYTDVAVYLPYEDGVMKGPYPPERQRVWVWGEYELRYIYPPDETLGYHPLWINRTFLEKAHAKNGKLVVGDAVFSALYADVQYMDIRSLRRIVELARQGVPVCLKQRPRQPGYIKSGYYEKLLDALMALKNVSSDFRRIIGHKPLVAGDSLPEYWCRVDADGTHYLFLAHPKAYDLQYPIYSGQSYSDTALYRNVRITVAGKTHSLRLRFDPYQSVLLRLTPDGQVHSEDIVFVPRDPKVRPREPQKTYF